MQLNFTEVNYDGELEDADHEALVGLVERFEEAQEENAAEFEAAKDKVEELNGTVSEYEDAKQSLVEEVADSEQFSEVPLDKDELETQSFSKVREWKDFVEARAGESDSEEGEDGDGNGDGEFNDMGQKGATNTDGEEFDDEASELVSELSGVVAE